jgi:hypothetical protein
MSKTEVLTAKMQAKFHEAGDPAKVKKQNESSNTELAVPTIDGAVKPDLFGFYDTKSGGQMCIMVLPGSTKKYFFAESACDPSVWTENELVWNGNDVTVVDGKLYASN